MIEEEREKINILIYRALTLQVTTLLYMYIVCEEYMDILIDCARVEAAA